MPSGTTADLSAEWHLCEERLPQWHKQLDEPVWIEGQLDPVTVTGVPVDGDAHSAAHMPSLSTDSRTEKRLDETTGVSATAGDMNSRCAPPERGRHTRAFLRSPLF